MRRARSAPSNDRPPCRALGPATATSSDGAMSGSGSESEGRLTSTQSSARSGASGASRKACASASHNRDGPPVSAAAASTARADPKAVSNAANVTGPRPGTPSKVTHASRSEPASESSMRRVGYGCHPGRLPHDALGDTSHRDGTQALHAEHRYTTARNPDRRPDGERNRAASSRWTFFTRSEPSRSAAVRATRSNRSIPRADQPSISASLIA